MSFIKLGEIIEISRVENTSSCVPSVSPEVLENWKKFAANVKKVAPKAEDFLYFSAVMMHAAEASGYHDDGTPKLTASGSPVQVGWDKSGGTWKWTSNDSGIKPYKNSNGDIFPEEELIKAHKKWINRPLCIDHKSSSVDHVRGFIVDTYYDRNLKRVVALCALDKIGFPQLARQISTGVSSCVSMGTAVGKAICTEAGCHRMARTEADFCNHMKHKSGYGEINIDLNPLELSIVVNGADPKANIKNIIAAANTMNSYLENRNKELNKLASSYQATLIRSNSDSRDNTEASNMDSINVSGEDLESFKNDIERGLKELENLNSKISEKDTNDNASNLEQDNLLQTPDADFGLAPPHERYASDEVDVSLIEELHGLSKTIEAKLNQMKQSLNKLANTSIHKQEETMSGTNDMNKKGYYQGAGGVNEPTPGQAKYPKDPLNEMLREKEDRQMVGQSPFPEVGSVDGLHPSPDSAEPSNELDRKKMLARAEAEERAQRRQAIVNLAKQTLENKKAYYQGGGGVNEPAKPGTQKYPVDKLQYDLRDYEDKQMVGQKPFPGVGAVDGLHPSPQSADIADELKRKEMLRRAGLKATLQPVFKANGAQDLGKTAWVVSLDNKPILTASVNDLSDGKPESFYNKIATKEFGSSLIEKVRVHGADKIRAMFKSAQDLAAPAAPVDAGAPPADAPPMDSAESNPDTGKSGDPKAAAVDLAEKVKNLSSDLNEAVRALTGEQAEMGEMESAAPEMAAAASFSTNTLNSLRRELNSSLTHAIKASIASLNDHQTELEMISGLPMNSSNQELVGPIVEDALTEARTALADGFNLITAFVKYARGTAAIVKRAEIEAELEALAEGETMTGEHDANDGDDLMAMISDTNSDLDDIKDLMSDDSEKDTDKDSDFAALMSDDVDMSDMSTDMSTDDSNNLMAKPEELKDLTVKPGTDVKVVASFNSRSGRAALRAKLAADALGKQDDGEISDMSKQKFSDMLDQADRLADGQTELDVKPSDNLGRVETLPEVNKAMMDLAKAPPKVRKEAAAINKLVSEGKLDPSDLDALVAEGLDKDAVSYYKKYFAQTDGGGEFANELTKEHVKAALEEELNTFKIKMARSYELAYDMVDRGLCNSDRNAVSVQVDEIMKFNKESFDTLKNLVARHPVTNLRKEGGRMAQVGMIGSGESHSLESSSDNDMYAQLSAAFSKTSKRLF